MPTSSSDDVLLLPFSNVVLRPWQVDDAQDFAKHANNRNVWKYCSDRFPYPCTEQDATKWIQSCLDCRSSAGGLPSQLAIQHETAGVIGGIGIFHREGVQRFTKELGYWLGQEFWGQGIGAAAVTAFLGYIWATFPEAVRVEAVVYDYNDRSNRLLEKQGFKLEGRLLKAAFKDGQFCDSLVWALLRPPVQQVNSANDKRH